MRVRIHLGELPRFWDRSVVFFANLLSLFYGNEGQTAELASHVGGINSYGGRLLPILDLLYARAENLLVLERRPSEALGDHFVEELGLTLPRVEVLDDEEYAALWMADGQTSTAELTRECARITQHAALWVDGFVTDDRLEHVASALGKNTVSTCKGSKEGNNKHLLHTFLQHEGFDVFETYSAASTDDLPDHLSRLRASGYSRAVLKSQIGASGFGLIKVSTENAVEAEVPEYMFFEGPCLVQGWLDEGVDGVRTLGSPSVQMFLNEDSVNLYDLTEQVLSDQSIHEGNLAPPPALARRIKVREQVVEQAGKAGAWLHGRGYRGTASADFLIVERRGTVEVRICEINARVTGATYPAVLARHFRPGGAWLMRNLRFRAALDAVTLLATLDHAGCLFRPDDERGILPINFNADLNHTVLKGQFLCLADSVADCAETLARVESVLPVAWEYDRD